MHYQHKQKGSNVKSGGKLNKELNHHYKQNYSVNKNNYSGTPQLVLGNRAKNLMYKIVKHKGKCTLRTSIEA